MQAGALYTVFCVVHALTLLPQVCLPMQSACWCWLTCIGDDGLYISKVHIDKAWHSDDVTDALAAAHTRCQQQKAQKQEKVSILEQLAAATAGATQFRSRALIYSKLAALLFTTASSAPGLRHALAFAQRCCWLARGLQARHCCRCCCVCADSPARPAAAHHQPG
jgi:hypothetical protein